MILSSYILTCIMLLNKIVIALDLKSVSISSCTILQLEQSKAKKIM